MPPEVTESTVDVDSDLLKQPLPKEDTPYLAAIALAASMRTAASVYPPLLRRLFRPLRVQPVAARSLLADALLPYRHITLPEFPLTFIPDTHVHAQHAILPHKTTASPNDNSIGLARKHVPEIAVRLRMISLLSKWTIVCD